MSSEYVLLKSKAVSRWHSRTNMSVFDTVRMAAIKIQARYRGILEEGYLKE